MVTNKQIDKLTKLSLKELQQRFKAATGKQSKAPNKKYLARVIIETEAANKAKAGAKPAKPKKPGAATKRRPKEGDKDFMVLPFRLPRNTVVALDESWQATGYKNRTQFLKTAVARLLASEGQDDTAALFVQGQ